MKRFGSLAALLAVVLVASACGRSSGGGSATPTTGGETTTSAGGTAAGPGDFGTLKDVCGPGKNTMSPDQGVTPTAIDVATSSDPGFAGRRGLNQEIFDAGEVFTKWCNAAGGIHGRKIVLHEYDAALFNFDAGVKKACATDFFFVGNGNVFDNNPGQRDRLACLLPQIPTYLVTLEGRDSDLTVQPVPNRSTQYAVGPYNYVAQKFPDATKSVVTMTGNISATLLVDAQATEAAKDLGWTVKKDILYNPIGETTWVPFAQQIKDAGAKGLIYTGEPQNFALLAKALKQINYKLDFTIVAANHYDQNLIKDGGNAINNVYMAYAFVPFEDASKNPPTQQYPTCSRSTSRAVSRTRRWVPRPSPRGCCSRWPPTSAVTTSRASACTTPPRPTRTGPVGGSMHPRTRRHRPPPSAASCSRRRRAGSSSPKASSRTRGRITATRRTSSP